MKNDYILSCVVAKYACFSVKPLSGNDCRTTCIVLSLQIFRSLLDPLYWLLLWVFLAFAALANRCTRNSSGSRQADQEGYFQWPLIQSGVFARTMFEHSDQDGSDSLQREAIAELVAKLFPEMSEQQVAEARARADTRRFSSRNSAMSARVWLCKAS